MTNMNEHSRGRVRLIWAAMALLVAVLATTGGSLAAYRSSASGGDGARVARFQIEASVDADSLAINNPNGTAASATLTINNKSEVAVEVKQIIVTFPAALTDGVIFKLDNAAGTLSNDNKTHTFSVSDTLSPNSGSKAHTLAFTIALNAAYPDGYPVLSQQLSGVKVEFTATQID